MNLTIPCCNNGGLAQRTGLDGHGLKGKPLGCVGGAFKVVEQLASAHHFTHCIWLSRLKFITIGLSPSLQFIATDTLHASRMVPTLRRLTPGTRYEPE